MTGMLVRYVMEAKWMRMARMSDTGSVDESVGVLACVSVRVAVAILFELCAMSV